MGVLVRRRRSFGTRMIAYNDDWLYPTELDTRARAMAARIRADCAAAGVVIHGKKSVLADAVLIFKPL